MKKKNHKIPDCCKPICCQKPGKGIASGIISGIIPHAGCIAIIILALFGATIANTFLRKFLFNSYYLYILFFISLAIATFFAFLYKRRFKGTRIRDHWKYFTFLYSSVIIINLAMIYLIFPAVVSGVSGNYVSDSSSNSEETLRLSFDIPCEGHVPLVVTELKNVTGIKEIHYISGKIFEIFNSFFIYF